MNLLIYSNLFLLEASQYAKYGCEQHTRNAQINMMSVFLEQDTPHIIIGVSDSKYFYDNKSNLYFICERCKEQGESG